MVWWTAASCWPVSSAQCLGFSSGRSGGRKAKKVRLRNGSKDTASLNTGSCLKVSGSLHFRFAWTLTYHFGWCSYSEWNKQVRVLWPAQGHICTMHGHCRDFKHSIVAGQKNSTDCPFPVLITGKFCLFIGPINVFGHGIFSPMWCIW